jgi:hypothetical protein
MIEKIFALLLATVLLTTVSPAEAQQTGKVPRIGYLVSRSGPVPNDRGFQQGLPSALTKL